ncbi:MAG: hypothetical protein R3B06_30205 [Kofleriaceae bacterium]
MNRVVFLAVVVAAAAACSSCKKSKPAASEPVAKGGASADPGARGGVAATPPGGADLGAPAGADDQFQVETSVAPAAPGAEAVARVVVRPGKGFHMNKDYPTKLSLELPAGVTAAKTVLEPADAETFDDTQLAFAVKLTAATAGEFAVPGTLKFAVCTDSTCNPKKQAIALALKAQ